MLASFFVLAKVVIPYEQFFVFLCYNQKTPYVQLVFYVTDLENKCGIFVQQQSIFFQTTFQQLQPIFLFMSLLAKDSHFYLDIDFDLANLTLENDIMWTIHFSFGFVFRVGVLVKDGHVLHLLNVYNQYSSKFVVYLVFQIYNFNKLTPVPSKENNHGMILPLSIEIMFRIFSTFFI